MIAAYCGATNLIAASHVKNGLPLSAIPLIEPALITPQHHFGFCGELVTIGTGPDVGDGLQADLETDLRLIDAMIRDTLALRPDQAQIYEEHLRERLHHLELLAGDGKATVLPPVYRQLLARIEALYYTLDKVGLVVAA